MPGIVVVFRLDGKIQIIAAHKQKERSTSNDVDEKNLDVLPTGPSESIYFLLVVLKLLPLSLISF